MPETKQATVNKPEVADSSGGQTSNFTKTFIIIIIGLIFHAISGALVKAANFEPVTSAFLRVIIAFAALAPVGYYEVYKKRVINKKGFWLSIIGGLFLGMDFMFFNYSIFYAGSGIAMVLLNIQVIVLPALYLIFDNESPGKLYYILVPFMIIGLVLTGGVIGEGTVTGGPEKIFGWDIALLGTILGAASGTCYGFYLYFTRKAGTMNKGLELQPMVWANFAQLIPISIALWVVDLSGRGFDIMNGVLVNGTLPANPETMVGDPITATGWIYMIILGLGCQAICWTFIQYGSVRLKPSIVAGLLLLSPIAALFVGYFWLGEVPNFLQIVGVVIVLVCVAIQNGAHKMIFGNKNKQKA